MALDAVVEMQVPDELLIGRIEQRAKETGGTRADDNAETLKKRLVNYHRDTAPLVEYYDGTGKLRTVDGAQDIDDVTSAIAKALSVDA